MTNATRSRGLFRSPGVQLALAGVRAAIAEPGCALICGEPSTGRETVARAIHRATNGDPTSPEELLHSHSRTDAVPLPAPFLVADCSTQRDIESFLFGRCAAVSSHDSLEITAADGLLYRASGGTLFLRGVQDIPGRIQNRLARVLRDGEMWLDDGGSSRLVAVEARVIASVDSSREGELLEPELKKRLAVHRIELPPLRHRREDLPGLVRLLVAEICDAQQMPAKTVSSQAISLLCALPWRGNFTELRGLLQILVASPGRMIRVADVLTHVRLDGGDVSFSTSGTLKQARERFERDYVAAVLRQHHGRMAQAARVLGMQRPNLYRKVRQLAVTRKGSTPVSVEEDSLEIQ
jgi:DNA-binding NtrC family response regulator